MKYILFNHVGSANHGCEALVRTISKILGRTDTILISDSVKEEIVYGVNEIVDVKSSFSPKSPSKFNFIIAYLKLKLFKNYFLMDTLPYLNQINQSVNHDDIVVSIGGDIYCYDNYPKYVILHKYAMKKASKSILFGCSIEPELLKDKSLRNDFNEYNLIIARESITYNALKSIELSNVVFCPDSAFILDKMEAELPYGFKYGDTIGLNVSPLVIRKEKSEGILLENYEVLIEHILGSTDASVALIPHVFWEDNNDSEPLKQLFDKYKSSGRICLIEDSSVNQLKGYISRCRMFIGARTHATIAAYSSCVPTVAVGYSVKSKGIAKDLFGTDTDYVVPVEAIEKPNRLLEAYLWLEKNEIAIKSHLEDILPEYIKPLETIGEVIGRL